MKKLKVALLIVSVILALIFVAIFLLGYFKPKGAGLLVNTSPSATVFIDGVQVGRSPYKATLEPKDITLRLVPDVGEKPLTPFETKLNLNSGIETIVNREIKESEALSSGEIISFEKVGKEETSLSIVSVPDAAQITIDGQIRGFAPYKTSSILPGEHQVIISAPGYNQKVLKVKTIQKYKLVVIVKLSINLEEQVKKEEALKPVEKKIYVEILDTPTGFLRVRAEASTTSIEIGQVKPGEKYELLEETEGWFKIKFTVDKEGWVSSQYAKKLEETTPSPSPKPTTSPLPTASPGPTT
ncbi:PEGA domain-containing protein [Candidatus Woesebacteria bacterium]|nr:PEGA domain-containing protein [Candidatus Woesebacteria bacterium]